MCKPVLLRDVISKYLFSFLILISISFAGPYHSYGANEIKPLGITESSQLSSHLKVKRGSVANLEVYSETVYDSRINGATTDSRIREVFKPNNYFKPWLGLTFTKDLSNGRAPENMENAVGPSLGASIELADFLWIFAEGRHLFRHNNARVQSRDLNKDFSEIRSGYFIYNFKFFKNYLFNEFYNEAVVVDRVSSKPVFSIWNKLGKRSYWLPNWRTDTYIEAFSRQSPDLGYGPTENELRLGARISFFTSSLLISGILNYSPLSNINPDGWDALLTIGWSQK